jgi:hypothetical protein
MDGESCEAEGGGRDELIDTLAAAIVSRSFCMSSFALLARALR